MVLMIIIFDNLLADNMQKGQSFSWKKIAKDHFEVGRYDYEQILTIDFGEKK